MNSEVSKDPHLSHLPASMLTGGWLLWGLSALETQFPMFILRPVKSEQTSTENQSLCACVHISRWAKCGEDPCRAALLCRGNFSSGGLT